MDNWCWIAAYVVGAIGIVVIVARIEFKRQMRDSWCCRYCESINSKDDGFCQNCGLDRGEYHG
jgi:hypothetical protein